MNILVLGSGGREYMLAWKIRKSKSVDNLYIAPGNGGTADLGKNVNIDWQNLGRFVHFIKTKKINMLVVGPEMPLVDGLVDRLKSISSLSDLMIVGPGKAAARLEGSKAFAKTFMEKHDIPTAQHKTFTKAQSAEAVKYIQSNEGPYVLKADGLAGGKGVVILSDTNEAVQEAQAILNGKFGHAGNILVIESFLEGLEFSVFALCSKSNYILLPVAKDYKRIGEGDSGLNTGGMGSVSPVPGITADILKRVDKQIVKPTLQGLHSEGTDYVGFLFFGLILVDGAPYVIEYNCRLGDPETQAVLPRIENDFVELLKSCVADTLKADQLKISENTTVCTILASEGYPGSYEKGKEMHIQNQNRNIILAHAGTARKNGQLITSGGRVMGSIGLDISPKRAKMKSQKGAASVQFKGKYFRSDIGSDLGI